MTHTQAIGLQKMSASDLLQSANSAVTLSQQKKTASVSTSSSSSSTSSSSSGDVGNITGADFLTLLVSELQNQDPTNPTDPQEYVQQLVGVNSLQQLIQINEDLGGNPNS
ncbi:MAG: flagellar hook capping FlgD N-terminal domain-containing protein [Acidobacteriaceae bacterium]|nr:flagellar hook capping FlgD N-terminal domain-containing protein [Acidobacteriaceae bacterium]